MEKSLHLFALYLGLDILELCNGYPVDLHSAGLANTELRTSLAPFLAVAFLVCSVVLLAGCLCCRQTKGFQEFTDSTSSHSLSGTGGYVNNAASTTEFTIFPPLPAAAQRQTPGDRSSVVRFEPLPDIKPSQPHSRRPAAFNNVVSHGLSAQDWFEDPHVNFPRHQMKYLRELGRGWFGRVVEGEAQGIVSGHKTSKLVVKILHEDATATDHMYFLHEVKPYRDLKHANILKLLGRCLETDPFLVLLESCPSGDLKSFLSQNISTAEALSQQGVTLLMGCHIAAGLQHMHQHGFVHTDLAARNCLVTSDLTVKIGDYGTSIETFKDDYYCAGDVALPIRWCAPETLHCTETTIETKEVTPGANVWNLGVVLWEICEFGKLPYSELTDDEVIVKVLGEGTQRLALPTRNCPHRQNLYLLMKLCWSTSSKRPALPQVLAMLNHLYLSRDRSNQDGDTCSLKTDEDFERRWETFKPNTIPKMDNHTTANNSTVHSPSLSYKELPTTIPPVLMSNSVRDEINKQDNQLEQHRPFLLSPSSLDNIVIATQDSTNLMTDMNSVTPLTTSPQPSITSSSGGEFFIPSLQQRHKSPSLQNLRGSLDDLCEGNGEEVTCDVFVTEKIESVHNIEIKSNNEEGKEETITITTLETEPEKSIEVVILEPDFDSWLQGVETTDEEDAKFVRKISEAIRDLDNALALEKTSSSSSSETSSNSASHHQSPVKEMVPPTSDQNVVLDFRLGPMDLQEKNGAFPCKEDLFQLDSLQEDSLMDKSLPQENRTTDSGTDTEDETWRRRIECGEFSQKVKEKSKSVADLMILTHIECSDGSDSEPPSLTWSFERSSNGRNSFSKQRRGSNLTAAAILAFGSESNIHQAILGEEFRDTLLKLHEAQKDNKNIKLGATNSVSLQHQNKLEPNLAGSNDPLLLHEEDVNDAFIDGCNSASSNYNKENVFLAIDASERINLVLDVLDPGTHSEVLVKDIIINNSSTGASSKEHLLGRENCEIDVQNNRQVPDVGTLIRDVHKPSHHKLEISGDSSDRESEILDGHLTKSLPLNIPLTESVTYNIPESTECKMQIKLENDNVPKLIVIESTQLEVDTASREEIDPTSLNVGSNDSSGISMYASSGIFNEILANSSELFNCNHLVDDISEKLLIPLSASTPNHDASRTCVIQGPERSDSSVKQTFGEDSAEITPIFSETNSSLFSNKQSNSHLDNITTDSSKNSENSFTDNGTSTDSFDFFPINKSIHFNEICNTTSVKEHTLPECFSQTVSTSLYTAQLSSTDKDNSTNSSIILVPCEDCTHGQSSETYSGEPALSEMPDHSTLDVTPLSVTRSDSQMCSLYTNDTSTSNDSEAPVPHEPSEDRMHGQSREAYSGEPALSEMPDHSTLDVTPLSVTRSDSQMCSLYTKDISISVDSEAPVPHEPSEDCTHGQSSEIYSGEPALSDMSDHSILDVTPLSVTRSDSQICSLYTNDTSTSNDSEAPVPHEPSEDCTHGQSSEIYSGEPALSDMSDHSTLDVTPLSVTRSDSQICSLYTNDTSTSNDFEAPVPLEPSEDRTHGQSREIYSGEPALSDMSDHSILDVTPLSVTRSDSQMSSLYTNDTSTSNDSEAPVPLEPSEDRKCAKSNDILNASSVEGSTLPPDFSSCSVSNSEVGVNDFHLSAGQTNYDSEVSVILGACENYTLDYFKGLKTTFQEEDTKFPRNEEPCVVQNAISTPEPHELKEQNAINEGSFPLVELNMAVYSLNITECQDNPPSHNRQLPTEQSYVQEMFDKSSEMCVGFENTESTEIVDQTVQKEVLNSNTSVIVDETANVSTLVQEPIINRNTVFSVEKDINSTILHEISTNGTGVLIPKDIISITPQIQLSNNESEIVQDEISVVNIYHEGASTTKFPTLECINILSEGPSYKESSDSIMQNTCPILLGDEVGPLVCDKSYSTSEFHSQFSSRDLPTKIICDGKESSIDFLQQEVNIENAIREMSAVQGDTPENVLVDENRDLSNRVKEHINKQLDKNILGSNNFSSFEDKLNNFSASLCVPSLNFIAATPIHSGRNSPELLTDEANPNISLECVSEEEVKIVNNSQQIPLAMNIVSEAIIPEVLEIKLQNVSHSDLEKNMDEIDHTLEKEFHKSTDEIPCTLTPKSVQPVPSCVVSPSPNNEVKYIDNILDKTVDRMNKSDHCDTKTDTQSIISQLTKEVPFKVIPNEKYINIDVAVLEDKDSKCIATSSSPEIHKTEFDHKLLSNMPVHKQLNLEEHQVKLQMTPQPHQFCFTESNDTFMKALPTGNDAVENWKKQNIEMLAEDFLQAALDEKSFDHDLDVQDFSSVFQVGRTETPVELDDDGEDFGLDVAKHSTPDDERSSDSGFRDKGSLSESCEDACDEKYNLEDIEAELEETFNKGGFNYVVKGLEGDEEDIDHSSVHLDQPNKHLEGSEELFSGNYKETPEESSFNKDKSGTETYQLKLQSDQLGKLDELIEETPNEHLDGTLIPLSSNIALEPSNTKNNKLNFEENELNDSSTPDKTLLGFQNCSIIDTPDLLNIETCDTPMPDLTSDRNTSTIKHYVISPVHSPTNSNLKSAFSEGFDLSGIQSRFSRENDLMLDIGKTEFRTFSPESGISAYHDTFDISPIRKTGWFLHPPSSSADQKSVEVNYEIDADIDDIFMSPKSTSSTSSNGSKIDENPTSENSYVPFSIDEAFVTAIRNELQEKLPCARQQSREDEPEEDGVIDPEDDLPQEERADIMIHYNVYPAPLSPILEERESVSSITTTVSDNYSPFVSTTKGGTRQDSDSEPTSPVFVLDSVESGGRMDTKKFEEEIREALENCSLSSGETDSSGDKGQQNSSVLFEDLDQSLPSNGKEQGDGKHVTVVRDTFQQPDYDDDFLVVDTETNKATLLESPKPKSYLAFVNNKRTLQGNGLTIEVSPSSDFIIPEEEMSIDVNSDTFLIKRGRIDNREMEEWPGVNSERAASDDEVFTPDSISSSQDKVPSSSTLFSPDTDNLSAFFLTPSEKSPEVRENPNTPLDLQIPAAYNPYFSSSLANQNCNGPTYDDVQEISLGVANNEAAEIMSELESSGIFNNSLTHEDVTNVGITPVVRITEDASSRTTSENEDSEALSFDDSSDSLKSSSRGSEKALKKPLSLNLPTLEQSMDTSESYISPKKINSEDCLELSVSLENAEEENENCTPRLQLNDTLDLYKKKKASQKDDTPAAIEDKDWSVTSLEATLLSTKAPMPSPEEESWKQIPSMLAFSDLNEVISRCDDEDGFGEIMFTGPASPVYPNQDNDDDLMSTSFSLKGDSEDLADCYTPDWESESEDTNEEDNNSSSSGEFIWKEGDREASVKAVDMSASDSVSKPYEGLSEFPMEVIAEEEEGDDDEEEDADGSSSSGSGTEFVPSAWNSEATPNRSALRSPDKKSDQKKNVSFKKQKYHCVYEYPRETSDSESEGLDSPSRRRWDLYRPDVDYSCYADWELMDGDVPETTAPDMDTDPEVPEARSPQTFDFYKLSSVDYDFGNGVMSEDGEFYISSSARPFQFNTAGNDVFGSNGSQFFPGQLYHSIDEQDNAAATAVAVKDVTLNFVSLDSDASVDASNKMSTLGVSIDSCEDEVDTSVAVVTVAHESVDPIVSQNTNKITDDVRPGDLKLGSPMHIREVSHTNSSAEELEDKAVAISDVADTSCKTLTDTVNRISMPSSNKNTTSEMSATSANEVKSVGVVVTKSLTSSVNEDNSLEKDLELIETPTDFSPSSPLSPTSGLGELRHTRDRLKLDLPASSSAFILDPPALGKRRSVEAVKGEASLLDSGEETEDSGIESSNGTTTSRATDRVLEQSDSFVLSSNKV